MTAVISHNAQTILEKRYLAPNETIDGMFRRVSLGNEDYYRLMSDLLFLPNSPTLFNAGLNNGCTLSACFVLCPQDTMLDGNDSIVTVRAKAIAIAKAGGGVGYYFGHLRPKGAPIKSVHRKACGPVTVLKDYHAVSKLITQGGKRELAQMGILNASHPDIREFIHLKDEDPQSLNSFNLSVSWRDEQLKRAFAFRDSKERELWNEQVDSAWRTGDPGMFFHDTVNRFNPNLHYGVIYATNPCGETGNRNGEPCNLGSLVLRRLVTKAREVNWNLLEEIVYRSTWFLDDILDANTFPHPDITQAALATRKLGLGVMGWADLLALLGIHYDTEEAVALAGKLMKFVADVSLQASLDMAKKKGGPYLVYDTEKTQGPCARNETRTSVAPTGTISIIADCSSSIEPHYALEWERTTNEGLKLQERIAVWDDLDGFRPKTAAEIDWRWHVRHQAAFQQHTCLGTSKTINLPNSATREDVSNAYRMMFESGCKGGTVFRDGCRDEQVLVSKKTSSVYATGGSSSNGEVQAARKKLPARRASITHKFKISGMSVYLTVGLYEDGQPAEVFVTTSKLGSSMEGMVASWARLFSVALQSGMSLERLVRKHIGVRFEPSGLTDNADIPVCTSLPDYVVRWLAREFLAGQQKPLATTSGIFCPDCGAEAIYQAGCLTCSGKSCGWSRCG